MDKQHLTLDEALLVEKFGDIIRSDVFPSRHFSIKTLKAGNPTNSFYFVDSSGTTILLLKIGEDNRISSIYSTKSQSELDSFFATLANIDPQLSKYLQSQVTPHFSQREKLEWVQINDGHELVFKPHSNRMNIVLQHDLGKEGEALDELMSYGLDKLPLSPKSVYTRNLDDVVTVVQKEYAVISSKKGNKKVANTYGLADCIALVLYDKENQVASIAHIDGGTNIESSIPSIMHDLSDAGGERYEARLFGGYKNSARQFISLIKVLRRYGIEVVEADILDNAQSRAIGISVDGKMYNNIFEEKSSTFAQRASLAGVAMDVPLYCHYKP